MLRYLLLLLPFCLTACPTTSSDDDDSAGDDDDATSNDDDAADDDDAAGPLGDVDTNGDGMLTPDDVAAGQIALIFEYPGGRIDEAKADVGTSQESDGDYAFGDDWTYATDEFWTVLLRIQGADPIETGTFPLSNAAIADFNASFDGDSVVLDDPGGSIEVTLGGATTSGYLLAPLTVNLENNNTPTGETATVIGMAWNTIDVVN